MRRILCLALAGVLAASAAAAEDAPRRQRPDPDANHDGKVTLAELRQVRQGRFLHRLDADKDGRVSRAEFDAGLARLRAKGRGDPARPARLWAMLDANKDGYVTEAEREATLARRFNAADTNHDGWLSKSELSMMRQNRASGG